MLPGLVLLAAACGGGDDSTLTGSRGSGPAGEAGNGRTGATSSIVEVRPTQPDAEIPDWVGEVVNLHDLDAGTCFNNYSWVQDDRQVELDTASMFMAVLLITLIGSVLYGGVILMGKLVVPRDARLG